MNNVTYTLKISPQGQLTLPRGLRERLRVKPGSRIAVVVTNEGNLQVSHTLPIEKHFGKLSGAWTTKGQDASDYTRALRDSMQPKPDRKP
jgi:AbrB family looped-hinge helix DNA binding protein